MAVSITNFTKRNSPFSELFLSTIAKEILGVAYETSITFVGDRRAQQLNVQYRQKSYVPNVLSFPLDAASGEVVLNLRKVEHETKKFDMPYKKLCLYLLIHGMLHLKGLDHGPKMDSLEQKLLQKFYRA